MQAGDDAIPVAMRKLRETIQGPSTAPMSRIVMGFACAGVLSACGPEFPVTGYEFDAQIKAAFPIGTPYSAVESELIKQGFRSTSLHSSGFAFSTLSGHLQCGQMVNGNLDANRRITKVWAYQGCFRPLTP
jgi:hypothetical protein